MEKSSNSTALTLTLLLGILLQVLFVFADTVDTPNKTAVEFSKSLFQTGPRHGQLPLRRSGGW